MYYFIQQNCWSTVLSLAILLQLGNAHADETSEINVAKIKAAVIFNLFRYIEWPIATFNSNKAILCTDNESEVSLALQSFDGKMLNGKQLEIRSKVLAENFNSCHMVYLETPKGSTLRDLRSYPVVSIANGSSFIEEGGMIALVADGEHLGFEINQELALSKGIRISALVLKLAKSIRNGF